MARVLTRRLALTRICLAAGSALIAACSAPPPVATSVTPPAKPTEPPKPAALTTAPAPTTAPVPTAAPAPTTASAPAATAAGAPTPAPDLGQIGKRLIGKLEGAEIVTDPAKMPQKFNEAPMLTQLVKDGKLPPPEKRLPEEPMVLKPVGEIGRYGGTWRRGFTGPTDGENMNRIMGTDRLLFVDYTGVKIVPSLAKEWKVSDGGRTITLVLRKGLKWSDGEPFTADDVMFWYEDLYLNKDITPIGTPEMSINGKPGKFVKVDDLTVQVQFPDPYPMFLDVLSAFTQVGSGHALGGTNFGGFMGAFAPAHYLKQFHPKYVSKEELDQKVQDAKLDNWVLLLKSKNNYQTNTECPVMTPWRTTSPNNTPSWVLERNPYFWCVDSDGNQLPYIDKVSLTLAENLEVANLRAIAGEYDLQTRHLDLAKLPLYIDNQDKGNYKVWLDPTPGAAATALHVNQSYEADPEVGKWLANRYFRRALSLGIDRDQLNETFFLGLGVASSLAPEDGAPDSSGPEWRTKWSTYDPKQANELLDEAGLDKKDSEGFRLRTDGKGRLRIEITTVAAAFLPWAQQMEMVAQQWKKIGIQADIKDTERNLAVTQSQNNETQIYIWGGGNEDIFLWPRADMPVEPLEPYSGALYAKWYASNGTAGKKPTDPELLKAMDLLRSGSGVEEAERVQIAKELKRLIVDNLWVIGTVGFTPNLRIISNKMGNVPERISWRARCRTPGCTHPSTYYFKS